MVMKIINGIYLNYIFMDACLMMCGIKQSHYFSNVPLHYNLHFREKNCIFYSTTLI